MRNLMFIAILAGIVFVAAKPALEKKAEQMVDHAVTIGSRGHFEEGIRELDRVDRYLGWTEAAGRVEQERAYFQQQLGFVAASEQFDDSASREAKVPEVKVQIFGDEKEDASGGHGKDSRFPYADDEARKRLQKQNQEKLHYDEVECGILSEANCRALLDDLGFAEFKE